MSDAAGSANVPLSTSVTPTASVAGMSDSDAQTAVALNKQTQRYLENKMSSVDEDRGKTDRRLAKLLISVALDSVLLPGLPELIDSKLASHHKRLTRLLEDNNDDLITEVSSILTRSCQQTRPPHQHQLQL